MEVQKKKCPACEKDMPHYDFITMFKKLKEFRLNNKNSGYVRVQREDVCNTCYGKMK
jgi:hypothetical protein